MISSLSSWMTCGLSTHSNVKRGLPVPFKIGDKVIRKKEFWCGMAMCDMCHRPMTITGYIDTTLYGFGDSYPAEQAEYYGKPPIRVKRGFAKFICEKVDNNGT